MGVVAVEAAMDAVVVMVASAAVVVLSWLSSQLKQWLELSMIPDSCAMVCLRGSPATMVQSLLVYSAISSNDSALRKFVLPHIIHSLIEPLKV